MKVVVGGKGIGQRDDVQGCPTRCKMQNIKVRGIEGDDGNIGSEEKYQPRSEDLPVLSPRSIMNGTAWLGPESRSVKGRQKHKAMERLG